MTDSSSFTSLFALVDSHLSKCNLNESPSEDGRVGSLPMPTQNLPRGLSDTRLTSPPQRLAPSFPTFTFSERPIDHVLSAQLNNMFKAKQLRMQQEMEQEKLQEEMRKMALEEKSCVIDLMKAVRIHTEPAQPEPQQVQGQQEQARAVSPTSSFDSLVMDYREFASTSPILATPVKVMSPPKPEPELLPLKTDMSYILKQKIRTGKPSAFGKVISSRLRPVAAPYLREKVSTNIVRFDFSTPSPCDMNKERQNRKPMHTSSNTYQDFL